MKSILVGKSGNDRVYFVVDARDEQTDCIVKNIVGDVRFTNFWEYVDNNPGMHRISGTKFHDYLWNGHLSNSSVHWYSVFVGKSLPIHDELLDGSVVSKDVLRRVPKSLDYENRAMDFRLAKNTGQWSQKMISNWIDSPERKFKKGKRRKKSKNG